MYFKIFLLVIFFNSTNTISAQDLLEKRIIKYNKIEKKTIKVDSNRLSSIDFFIDKKIAKYSTQIIHTRKLERNYFSFFGCLILLLFFSFVRIMTKISFVDQFIRYIAPRGRSKAEIGILTSSIIFILFVLTVAYLLYSFISNTSTNIFIKHLYLKITASIFIFIVLKFFIYNFITSLFDLKNKIHQVQYYTFEFMYIFVAITLPIFFIGSVSSSSLQMPLYIGSFIALISIYLILIIKLIQTNFSLLTRHVFKSLIYFYTLEIIPILLLSKYFKTFVV